MLKDYEGKTSVLTVAMLMCFLILTRVDFQNYPTLSRAIFIYFKLTKKLIIYLNE